MARGVVACELRQQPRLPERDWPQTDALAARVIQLYKTPKAEAVPDTLEDVRYLPSWTGLDFANPDSGFRYGL